MKTWKAKYAGVRDSGYGPQPHFYKKDGSAKGYGNPAGLQVPVQVDEWVEITVDDQNGWVISQMTKAEPPQDKPFQKGGWKSQPYHAEQFVSNVVGQAIASGIVKSPGDIGQWAKSAAVAIMGVQTMLEGSQKPVEATSQATQQSPQQNVPPNPPVDAYQNDLDNSNIPF